MIFVETNRLFLRKVEEGDWPYFRVHLTDREKELVELIYEGRSNAEIAEALFISESTVKTHIYNIFKKMRIKNRMSVMRIVRDEEEPKNEQPEKTEA